MTTGRLRELDRMMRERPRQVPAPVPPSLAALAKRNTATNREEHDRGRHADRPMGRATTAQHRG
jgi:hypothetical protein